MEQGVPGQLLHHLQGCVRVGCPLLGQPGPFPQESLRQDREHHCRLNITICEQRRDSGRFQSHGGVIARGCHSLPDVPGQCRGCEWVLGASPSLPSCLPPLGTPRGWETLVDLPGLAGYTQSNLSETGLTSRLSQVWLN